MSETFIIQNKSSFERWFVDIGISAWLDGETIQNANFSAKNVETGADATADVLDATKNTYDASTLKPYVKGGTSGSVYAVLCRVVTVQESYGEFVVKFKVLDV